MKVRLGFGNIKNLVLELKTPSFWIKVIQGAIVKVVLIALLGVVAYYAAPFFYSSEPLNITSCTGSVCENLWSGESIPRYFVLAPIFWALLVFSVFLILWPSRILESWKTNSWVRLIILLLAAAIGLVMTPFIVSIIDYLIKCIDGICGKSLFLNSGNGEASYRFRVNLSLLVMSLPVLLVLWWFRTYDTRQQIEKTQEQIEEAAKSRETSTYNNLLAVAMNMLVSDKVAVRGKSLVQLALVRHKSPELQDQIDVSTQSLILYQEDSGEFAEEFVMLRRAGLQNMNLSEAVMHKAVLESANLYKVNLEKAHLTKADLRGADLREADLSNADLNNADLREANLNNANLTEANLNNANLTEADLSNANLRHGNLTEANLSNANLRETNLTEAYLRRANLEEANLREAFLSNADLSLANLSKANLTEAYLAGANLSNANLREADLGETFLSSADLSNANLEGADLSRVIFMHANLEGANLEGANYDRYTSFPTGFDPKARGLINIDET